MISLGHPWPGISRGLKKFFNTLLADLSSFIAGGQRGEPNVTSPTARNRARRTGTGGSA